MKDFEDKIIKALDKSGSDKQYNHNYSIAYSKFLFGKTINNMLEIGIANYVPEKSSLWAWKEIFPETNIYAVDIDGSKMVSAERIKTYIVDQSSKESLSKFKRDLDIEKFEYILDDGSHVFDHAKVTFEELFDILEDDGIYLIEDVVKSDNGWQQSVKDWQEYLSGLDGIEYDIVDCKPEEDDDSIVIGIWRK